MIRCTKIVNHELFRRSLNAVGECERNRIYCPHDFGHSVDTARIAYIKALEDGIPFKKDIIYAAALLHDIGRHEQYLNGTPHEDASARIAEIILPECGYTPDEVKLIVSAILTHRNGESNTELGRLLLFADKKSRMCITCAAYATCKWDIDKRNDEVEY